MAGFDPNHPVIKEHSSRAALFKLDEALKSIEMSPGCHLEFDYAHELVRVADKTFSRIYKFSEVQSVEMRIDEVNSSGRSVTSVLQRAALLGLLTGGAGAIVGAVTAKTVHKREIRRVAVAVATNDGAQHVHYLYSKGFFKGYLCDEAQRVAAQVTARVTKANTVPSATSPQDISAKLIALGQMREKGLLTEDEFQRAKVDLMK